MYKGKMMENDKIINKFLNKSTSYRDDFLAIFNGENIYYIETDKEIVNDLFTENKLITTYNPKYHTYLKKDNDLKILLNLYGGFVVVLDIHITDITKDEVSSGALISFELVERFLYSIIITSNINNNMLYAEYDVFNHHIKYLDFVPKLYLVTRTDNYTYDEYDSVLLAVKEEADILSVINKYEGFSSKIMNYTTEYICDYNKSIITQTEIIASFNAG